MKRCLGLLGLCFIQGVYAFSWHDLWVTPDQQAQQMMNQGQFAEAEGTFLREDWRAAAAYRAGHFEQAAKLYSSFHDEEAYYNQGNALARMGQYEQAIKAYDAALALNPKHQDAIYNRKIVEDLLKKDQQKQAQDQKQQDKSNQDRQEQDKQNQEQKKKDEKAEKNKPEDKQDAQKKDKELPAPEASEASREQQQSKDQWLRLIPDDPGGLMREKFLRDHLRRLHGWDQ